MQDYRRLRVWRDACTLVLEIRKVIGEFPSGYASLKWQMVKSVESTAVNIVEGCGATSQKEFLRFLDIRIKSTLELEYQLRLARDYEILSAARWQATTDKNADVRKILCGLRARVLTDDPS